MNTVIIKNCLKTVGNHTGISKLVLLLVAFIMGVLFQRSNEYAWNKLLEGQYNQLRLQFLGSDNQPLKILDPDTVIVMLIREKS